ncbi:YicC family protein [Polycladomyces sp. WAk]|uniref:YicC family protein n=2 Tax=Polycladomyces zharkentensis TaxID=2807616 RepID=A0ABS2WFK9_9BACL|nr:YicC family protein [Polycladomyces sp. WAk]
MAENRNIRSMTGYGRGDREKDGIRFIVEIRSVNHRFLEIMVRLPSGWMMMEDPVKKAVQSVVKRGRVDVFVTLETEDREQTAEVDWQLAQSIVDNVREMNQRLGLSGEPTAMDLLQIPQVWALREREIEPELHQSLLLEAVHEACEALLRMRQREGQALAEDLARRIGNLTRLVDQIRERAPVVVEEYRTRLRQRLSEFLSEVNIDEDRLLTEAAIFADKSDIQEELTRLESHARQFLQSLGSNEPVGRRLDFLLQEMNREVNTIGSKSGDRLISSWVVECKSELEKMKEQVQNIE